MWMSVLVCLLALSIVHGASWTRLDPNVVENGTHISKNSTHITFTGPNGTVTGFPQVYRPWNASVGARRSVSENDEHVPAATASGWVSSFWAWGTAFSYISGQWSVPHAPTNNNGQIIFFFNSMQGAFPGGSGNDILQPVLQFNNGVGGWTLASWYGDGNGYTSTTAIPVNPGDTITGVVTLSSGIWYIYGYVNGVLTTSLSISQADFNNGDTQNTIQWVLEVYNMNSCDMYPPVNELTMNNIYVKDQGVHVTPSWGPPSSANADACNANGVLTSSSVPTINWQSGHTDLGTPVIAGLEGVDMVGNDLSQTTASSALGCASACDANSACNAWAYDSCGGSTCWLKTSGGTRSSNTCRTSGLKVGNVGIDRSGGDLPGMPITLPSGSTASTCAAYCQGNGGCVGWAFDNCGTTCWLKATVTGTSSNSCRTSGVKGALFIDHSGSDLSNTVLGADADTTDCATLCEQTSGCTGWAFALPAPGCDNYQRCWLKTGETSPTNNYCRITSW